MSKAPKVRQRATQLYDYLAALALELSQAPARALSDYDDPKIGPSDIPAHQGVRLSAAAGSDAWLTVQKVEAPKDCDVPEVLRSVLAEVVTTDPNTTPQLPEDISLVEEDFSANGLVLEDVFDSWLTETWIPWADRVRVVVKARTLYNLLYNLRLRLAQAQATHELVWGFGVLCWRPSGVAVQHPVLLASVRLEMDAESGAITVGMEAPPALDLDFLQGLDIPGVVDLTGLREILRASPPDPWGPEALTGVYEQFVAPLGVDARVATEAEPLASPGATPVVVPTWRLFIRRRPVRYQRFYADLRDAIDQTDEVPAPIAAIVATEQELNQGFGSAGSSASRDEWTSVGERLLMPLPTNEDQERIAQQLAHRRGVTVQGPPGTGKSHTIANLICHLVAHGKRALVTAQNEQALAVLREKIPEDLQDFSISVLGNSQNSIGELQASVQTIMEVVAEVQPEREISQIDEIAANLDAARTKLRQSQLKLLELLRLEGSEFPLPSGPAKAANVARWLSDNAPTMNRIPDQIAPDIDCPLTATEIDELCRLARDLTPSDAVEAVKTQPQSTTCPSANQLMNVYSELDALRDELSDVEGVIADWRVIDSMGSEDLRRIYDQVREGLGCRQSMANSWAQNVLSQCSSDPQLKTFWAEQLTALERQTSQLNELTKPLLGHRV